MRVQGSLDTYRIDGAAVSSRESYVFRAFPSRGGPPLAVKMASGAGTAEAVRRERSILDRLGRPGHPNLVSLRDHGEHESIPWFATDWIAGGSLGDHASSHRSSRSQLRLIHSIASALAYIHAQGVVHADVSPANIGLDSSGNARLWDFGAASEHGDSGSGKEAGTLGYTAPERLRKRDWDSRADIYSLACVWYELATGRPVFSSDTASGIFQQHLSGRPVPPSLLGASMDHELERLLLRALEKDPYDRVQRAADLVAALGRHIGAEPEPPELSVVFRPRLQGRSEALGKIDARLLAARGGSGSVLVVSGRSGSGKTRLLREVLGSARELGFTCVRGVAREAVRDGPIAHTDGALACFGELFECLSGALGAGPVEEATRAALAPLQLFDERLSPRLDGSHRPVLSDAAFKPLIFAALVESIAVVARSAPLFLAIDDAQFADDLTQQFLSSDALERLQGMRVVLMVGWNSSRSEPRAGRFVESVPIVGLSAPLVANMLSDMLGVTEVDPLFVQAVYRATQGLPLAVSELVTAALRDGLWVKTANSWTLPGASRVFSSLQERVRARLEGLPETVLRVAGLAALLGEEFEISGLEALAADLDDANAESVQAALGELLQCGIMTRAGSGSVRFVHGVYREACNELLGAEARKALHAALAHSLAKAPQARALDKRIGLHLAAAGLSMECVAPLCRAARAAAAVHAIEEAIRLLVLAFEHALTASGGAALPVGAARAGWLLMQFWMRVAEHGQLRAHAQKLLEACAEGDVLLRARVLRLLALSHRITGEHDRVRECLDAASALLAPRAESRRLGLRRELLEQGLMRVSHHYSRREFADAASVLRAMKPLLRTSAGAAQKAKFYMWQANVIALGSNFRYSRRAIAAERRAVAVHSRQRTLVEDSVMSQFDLGFMLLLGGHEQCLEAAEVLARAESQARLLNDAVLTCRITTYQAVASRRLRAEAQCLEFANAALALAERSGLRGYVGAAHACLAWGSLRAGDETRAEQRCVAAFTAWNGGVDAPVGPSAYPFQWLASIPLLAVFRNAERPEPCRDLLERLRVPSQARLEKTVQTQIGRALARWESSSDAQRLGAIDLCLRAAAHHRYL